MECELSVDLIAITLAIQWRRLGAGMQRLASAVPQLQHERGGAYRRVSRNALPVVTRDAMCNWMATPACELVRVKSLLAS